MNHSHQSLRTCTRPNLHGIASLLLVGVFRQTGQRIDRAAEAVGTTAQPAERIVRLDDDVDIGIVERFDDEQCIVHGAATAEHKSADPHLRTGIVDKAFESILLPDKFFAIADLHGLDNCLLDDLDLIALGVLELGEQLVDRRPRACGLDAVGPEFLTAARFFGSPRPPIISPPPTRGSSTCLPISFFVARARNRTAKAVSAFGPISMASSKCPSLNCFRNRTVACSVYQSWPSKSSMPAGAHPLETIQVIQVKVEVSLFEVGADPISAREMPRLMRDKGTVFAGTTVVAPPATRAARAFAAQVERRQRGGRILGLFLAAASFLGKS